VNYVVKMLRSFQIFYKLGLNSPQEQDNVSTFFNSIEQFLLEYLIKSKKNIFPDDFACLIKEVGLVVEQNPNVFGEGLH
jgi:hypothetical protein